MSFDRIIIILGVMVSLVTALVPVAVAVIGKHTKPSKEVVREIATEESFNITHDYVEFLKQELDAMRTQLEDLDFENDILREALMLNGIQIPPILDQILNREQ